MRQNFDVYWELGGSQRIPKKWPSSYTTKINLKNPIKVKNSIDGQTLLTYFGSSPAPLCPPGRTEDLSILMHAISKSQEYIYVAVSDYAPMNVFGKQRESWPVLDDLLREGEKLN